MKDKDKTKAALIEDLEMLRKQVKGEGKTKATLIKELEMLRKQTKGTSEENHAGFSTLFKHTPEPLFICKTEGTLVDCNIAMADLLGYGRADLIGKSLFSTEIFPENGLQRVIEGLGKKKRKATTTPDEFMMHRRGGTPVYVQASIYAIALNGENLVLGIAKDITEQKHAEEERIAFETQLRRAQKMEAIGTLAGGIAHEFNNILSPIMLHTELTIFDLPEDSPLRLNLEEVLEASNRARELINQILALSRQGEEEPYPLKIGPVIKETLKLLRSSLPSTIKIRQSIKTKSATILADPSQIHQVLMNLCTNAGRAIGKKDGTMTVTLDDISADRDDLPAVPDLGPGPYVRLTVSDTGHGMDQDVLTRIFDPHFTTQKKGRGTGLGLAVVHGIVSSYGGAISVESTPRKGSTFTIFLPQVETEAPEETVVDYHPPMGKERVLLVDDDISLLNVLQGALERLGYTVVAHVNSIEALAFFRAKPKQFDLVITDQTMPNLTGEYLSKEILQIRPDIPIILCTGFSETIDEKRAKSIGIREYITKPIALHKIAGTIREILDAP